MRTAIYARISHDPGGDAAGVARQVEDCRELVERNGWNLVETYIDNDVSALAGKVRPRHIAMMEAVSKGDVQVVVCYMLSRVWRNRRERAEGIEKLAAVQGRIVTVKGPDLDLSSATGRMLAGIIGEVDTAESEVKAERIARAHLQAAESGAFHGPRPFGYRHARVTDGQGRLVSGLEIEPTEADLIRSAVARLLSGDSLRSIAREWTAAGIRTARGFEWSPSRLRDMLTSPRNVGIRQHRPRDYAGRQGEPTEYRALWTPILDMDTWETLRVEVGDPSRRTNPLLARTNLLVGFAYCGKCGRRMYGRGRGGGQKRYVCQVPPTGCGGVARLREPVEDLVRDCVFHWLDSGAYDAAVAAAGAGGDDVDLVNRQRVLQGRLRAVEADYADGQITAREMRDAKKRVEAGLLEVRQLLATRQRREFVSERGEELRIAWESWSLEKRRSLLGLLVDRVVIHAQRSRARQFDPGSVDVIPAAWASSVDPDLLARPDAPAPKTQAERIADYVEASSGEITTTEVSNALDIVLATVQTAMKRMVADGQLCRIRQGRSYHYRKPG